MKHLKPLAILLALSSFLFGACSGDDVKAAMDKAADMDLSSMSAGDMQSKFTELSSQVTEKLGGITDLASAENVVGQVKPLLETLGTLKTALGDKLPSMESMGGIVDTLKNKFAGDDSIMNVIKPIIEKLQSLMG